MRILPNKNFRTFDAVLAVLALLAATALLAQPTTPTLQGRWGLTFEPHENQMIWGKCYTDYQAILDLDVSKTGEVTGTADLCAWPGPATVTNGSMQGDTAQFHLIGKNTCTCGRLNHPEFDVTAQLDGDNSMHVTMISWGNTTIPFSGRRIEE